MHRSGIAIACGLLFLIILGLRPQALPFIPGAQFSDAAISHWPAALRLHHADAFPFWQDTILGGQPFAANPLNKVAYPPQWLALILAPALHLNLLILLHLLIAAWGMWRWLRETGASEAAALFGALAFSLGPKVLAHLGAGHVDLLYALAWWPWLMLSVRRLAHGSGSVIHTALFVALLMLADLRLSLFALLLAVAYALWQWQFRRLIRPGLLVAGLALVLTLSVTLPLLAWGPYISRGDLSAADAAVFSLEPGQLLGLLLPPHSGSPETMVYLGLPVLLLAGIAATAEARKHAFWLVTAALALLYALGSNGPLWPLLVTLLPPLRWFRVPARAWFAVLVAACVLASRGLDIIAASVSRPANEIARLVVKRLAIAGGLGAALFCGGFTFFVLTDLPAAVGLGVMLVGGSLGLALLLALYSRLNPQQLKLALILILALDIVWTGWAWLEWRGPEQWLNHQEPVAEALKAENPARIYSPNYALEQQVAAANGLRLFYGVDPFQLTGIVEAIEQGSDVMAGGYSVIRPPLDLVDEDDMAQANQDAVPDTATLAQWAVSHVVATYPMIHPRLELRQQVDEVYVYANLDYAGQPSSGWPQNWPDLPDAATVAQLNQITLLAGLVSGVAFVLCLFWLLWRMRR